MIWQKCMKTLISRLANADAVRLPHWGLLDQAKRGAETVNDMDQCRNRWRFCIRNISSSVQLFNLLFCSRCFTIHRSFLLKVDFAVN